MNHIILIFIYLSCILIGYLLGRLHHSGVNTNAPQSFFTKLKEEKLINNISIDDKKFVADIKTDSLERKYNSLGDVKKTEDNITDSVSKLKNLKR